MINSKEINQLLKEAQRLAPSDVWFIPNTLINSNLGISDATRKNYLQVLRGLGFLVSRDKKTTGLTRRDYLTLIIFRKLAEKLGSKQRANPGLALDFIPSILKQTYDL